MRDDSANRDLKPDLLLTIGEGLDIVLISENEVLVQFGTRSAPSELFRDTGLDGIPGHIFGRLSHGPVTLADLTADLSPAIGNEATAFISDLLDQGILTDASRNPVDQYLAYTFTGESPLGKTTVGLIGAGPIGARISHALLQQGIGRLTIWDDRLVDERWLQFLPLGEDSGFLIGRNASKALREHLTKNNHEASVESAPSSLDTESLDQLVESSDFVVVALEQLSLTIGHLINRLCLRARKPWIQATVDGNVGLVGPLFVPMHTACFNDYRVLADATIPNPEMARYHRRHMLSRQAGTYFTGLPTHAEIVAGHATLATLHFLLRSTCFAIGRVMVIDFDRMTIDVEDVLKLPRCPVCGTDRSSYAPPFEAELIASQ